MQNLNLYNYYDKSLADINKDYLEAIGALRLKAAPRKGKGGLVALFLAVILVAGGGGGYFYYRQKADENFVKAHYAKPSGPDLRSSEEKLGYVKVQIFEFADEPVKTDKPTEEKYESALAAKIKSFATSAGAPQQERPTAYDEKKQLVDSIDKIGSQQIPTPRTETASKPPAPTTFKIPEAPALKTNKEPTIVAKATPPVVIKEKTYAIIFEDVNKNQYDFLQKAGSVFRVKAETVDSKPATKTIWRLYRMDNYGDVMVGDKKANFIKDFNDKEEAIRFAKDNKIQSIIRSEDVDSGVYSARFCCTTLDNAKKFAETSNITNKTIRIIREE